jgi:hypothetical protein
MFGGMSDWEIIANGQITPGDFIELPTGVDGEVLAVAMGPGGDLLITADLHYPVAGGPDNVVTGGTYAIPAAGHTKRHRV